MVTGEKPKSRIEILRQEISGTSKEVVTLREMLRMGYWPKDKPLPHPDLDKLKRIRSLQKKISELQTQLAKGVTWKDLVKKIRGERMAESRKRSAEKRVLAKHRYEERKAAWLQKRKESIVHVGKGYSTFLHETEGDDASLEKLGLPVLRTSKDLATALTVDLKTLRWLTFHRDVVEVSHYVYFQIPKRTGGMRIISAPKKHLAAAQEWILENILAKLSASGYAHGFLPGKSIKSNAKVHGNPAIVVNMDLKDFFPTITFIRVCGLFQKFGYSGQVATLLAMLCTEAPRKEVNVEGRKLYVATGPRVLPQGSSCSPAITNLICKRLDARLHGLATKMGFAYSRYADDITLSTPNKEDKTKVGHLLGATRHILYDEGFDVNEKKLRIFGKHRRQEVTGLHLNTGQPAIPRFWLRRLRAMLHNCLAKGLESQDPDGTLLHKLHGMVAYVQMVSPDKAKPYQEMLKELLPPPPHS